ncbi:helix-turn-helix domain-containing protein [Clavibacter sepedonicus]|uniref:Transcriptional regulator n=2 Tax=Clavibacter sepedonicus TaxID=31964 RepID=B0RAU3_CLASE|nr:MULTISPECIES: helix-turn-helix transcriptional regulator [Clavibacter]MBD5381292.1 helix-turn-helix transcriptional regulator [Clavibacter sp.]OQJ48322.1 transcriptional regulator [Clavibacter sepedonicus]OQJ54430.1 transcriptional regulator [Clavibacter sepedonicus]CAQ02790.1 putative transcriptional regulator [Clavibacter sepedonicus]
MSIMWGYAHTIMPSHEIRKYSDLGEAIKHVRLRRGMTQSDLAEKLGFERFYVRELETGTRPPLFVTRLFRVLRLLRIRVTVSYDLREEERVDG